jgi:metal-responsive CopG/Arc/MetJ family transcriptional regulator
MEDFKKKQKVKVFFTMDEDVSKEFDEFVEKENINKSKFIQYLITKYMEENKNKEE